MSRAFWTLAVLTIAAGDARAQSTWTYRARAAVEASSTQANPASPVVSSRTTSPWDSGFLFVASADASWAPAAALRIAAGSIVMAADEGGVRARLREGYARVSVSSAIDVEAGKRLVRWGVGYGYAPTGILDPARDATDPTDRLGRNEGLGLARVDFFRGPASLTLVAALPREAGSPERSRVAAARLRTVLGRGFEVAVIGGATRGGRPKYGANVTHVIGRSLEWHGEVLLHPADGPAGRAASAAVGVQYTLPAGVNVVAEYHRNAEEIAVRNLVFLRLASSAGERTIVPELIAVVSADDGGWTIVPAVTWTPHPRIQIYTRATRLAGPRGSRASLAPVRTSVTLGLAARF